MKIYIIEVDYLSPTGNKVLTKVSQEGYKTIDKAIEFVMSRTDYKRSTSPFLHYGNYHQYTIREITIV